MKPLWILPAAALALFVCCPEVSAADSATTAPKASVSQCFKVRRLLKTDATHYWADWSNTCTFTIDAVYVMVGFVDHSHREMGNGVWPMYFVPPGLHRVTRFSAPVADFETVRVHRITTDSVTALGPDLFAIKALQKLIVPPAAVPDRATGKVLPYQPETAGNKTRY
jgi:hypothetical protein